MPSADDAILFSKASKVAGVTTAAISGWVKSGLMNTYEYGGKSFVSQKELLDLIEFRKGKEGHRKSDWQTEWRTKRKQLGY